MTYSIVDYTSTVVKLTEGSTEILFKKVYCTTLVDGDYLVFTAHNLETGTEKQQFKFLYTDCAAPTAESATDLKTAVDAILNSYAGVTELEYIVLLKQIDESEPEVITEIKNTFNNSVTFIYLSGGLYQITGDDITSAIESGRIEASCASYNHYTVGFIDVKVSLEENILLLTSKNSSHTLSNGMISDPDGFYPTLLRLKIHP